MASQQGQFVRSAATTHTQRYFVFAAIAVYVAAILWAAIALRRNGDGPPIQEVLRSGRLLEWLLGVAFRSVISSVWAIPAGVLAAIGIRVSQPLWFGARMRIATLVLSGASIALIAGVAWSIPDSWAKAAAATSILGLSGGWMVGLIGFHSAKTGRRLGLALALGGSLTACGGVVLAFHLVEDCPQWIPQAELNTRERRRLYRELRGDSSLQGLYDLRECLLDERDVNLVLAWLARGSGRRRVGVELVTESAELKAGVPIAWGDHHRYLNLIARCRIKVEDGRLEGELLQLGIGRVALPRCMLPIVSRWVIGTVRRDPRTLELLQSIKLLRLDGRGLALSYRDADIPSGVLSAWSDPSSGAPAAQRSRIYLDHLIDMVDELPSGDRGLLECVQATFRLAQQRSAVGRPVLENQAALIALGAFVGHPDLERLAIGSGPGLGTRKVEHVVERLTIRGRVDWRRHFFVSAALAALSDQAIGDAAGLLKEELDGEPGKSGFSFADLLADRAGTALAAAATRSAADARFVQSKLAANLKTQDFLPPAADLPEGLSDPELDLLFGGVGGERFECMEREIQRRIGALWLFRRSSTGAFREPQSQLE